jgi:hypothetical protein
MLIKFLLDHITLNTNVQYKILDIISQGVDFLNTPNITQPAGVYLKLKIETSLLPPVTYYTDANGSALDTLYQPVVNRFTVAENAIFYGLGLNDMVTSDSNLYSGTNDIRFYVEIDSDAPINTFKYYATYNGTYKFLVAENVAITPGVDQVLTYSGESCTIKFTSNTGHTLNDYWVVNCRSLAGNNIFGGSTEQFQPTNPATYFTFNEWSVSVSNDEDRPIKAGAVLLFKYKETNNADIWIPQTFISSKEYVNIEEWFIEDYAYQKWVQVGSDGDSIGPLEVCFRRGILTGSNPDVISQGSTISTTTLEYPVYMYFYSSQGTGSGPPSVDTRFTLQQSDAPVLFETVPTDTNQDVYYELSKTYPIINGNHYGNIQNQNVALGDPAIIDLNTFDFNGDFNAFSFGNGVESFRIRDDFNSGTMQFSPRANATIEGYEEQTVVQALTYSGIYTQTSAINRLNEFNLSLANFKYLDRFFGSIQKLFSRDTDLVVLQENKVSKVLYGKNLLSDSTGGGAIASVPEVLGTQISYEGEYGISLNPESFTKWGDNLYFTDARRGAVMALQANGLFEISAQGMKNWFKANLDTNVVKLGMMDPYFEHYTLSIDNDRKIKTCSISVTPTSLSFNGTVQKKSFYIESNTDWSVSVPTNDWLTISDYYGSNNGLIYVEVLENLGAPRNLDITVFGCTEDIIIPVTQDTIPPLDEYYVMHKCLDGSEANSIAYPADTFELDDRVTSGSDTYVIDGIINYNPGGTLITITATGLTGCPSAPTYEWYILYKCSDGSSANSQAYSENTFELNNRVTSGSDTYIVDGIINYNPGGTLLAITSTGLTGCPTPITYYELAECSPGTGYAFTTIVPDAVGRRYVLPSMTPVFYTYTGSTLSQLTPPSGYNGSIQITSFYSCP